MGNNARILVVEDDSAIGEFVSMALTDEGYSVAVADNGITALTAVKEFQPHLIFLDIVMPDMDGQSFLDSYRAAFTPIPIIACSASFNVEKWAKTLGVDDFLAKPFSLDELFDILKRYLPQ